MKKLISFKVESPEVRALFKRAQYESGRLRSVLRGSGSEPLSVHYDDVNQSVTVASGILRFTLYESNENQRADYHTFLQLIEEAKAITPGIEEKPKAYSQVWEFP